jgi:hypothetical protein
MQKPTTPTPLPRTAGWASRKPTAADMSVAVLSRSRAIDAFMASSGSWLGTVLPW